MIQRIQTLYLILAAGCVASPLFLQNFWQGVSEVAGWFMWPHLILGGGLALALLVVVLGYKDQKRQQQYLGLLRWGYIVFMAVLLAGYFIAQPASDLLKAIAPQYLLLGLGLPVLGGLFLQLAQRAIRRDLEKVAAMNRLR